jgi:hypothetical protein
MKESNIYMSFSFRVYLFSREMFEIMLNNNKSTKKLSTIIFGLTICILLVSSAYATWIPLSDAYSINSIPTGCLEVDDKLFSDFEVTGFAYGGLLEPTADSILIQGGQDSETGNFGIRFLLIWAAGSNQIINAGINFKVTAADDHCCIEDAALLLKAADTTGTGLVGAIENIYDADFLGYCLTSLATSSQTDDYGAFLTDSSHLLINDTPAPAQEIWVRADITVQGGTSGTASLYEVSMLYGHIPEPATVILLGLGSLAIVRIRRI